MFVIPTADDLVTFIQDFTGSTNDDEIKNCIFMAELSMRNVELPALRSDPYAVENIGVANENGRIDIPGDMNKPIVFFRQGNQVTTTATATGVSAAFTITLTSNPGQNISTGMVITGTGIGTGATITSTGGGSIGSVVTVSVANSGTVSGTITFSTPAGNTTGNGPFLVYDRIGDRDIISQGLLAQLYMQPFNVPQVIRGKFSEVYDQYQFLPLIGEGTAVNLYYYKAWPLLFSPVENTVISATGTVGSISGSGPWTASITGMVANSGLDIGDEISATAGTGSLGGGAGVFTVASLVGSTGITFTATGGTTPTNGTITNITLINQTVQTNAVLNTWAEGYVYATLREYYIKRHNEQDAQIYSQKFENAYNIVEDQNNLGKWSGGHTKLTSVWQPRQYRQYNIR
jgi:hypothetical protein